jgi:hypothetical protein
MFLLPLSAQVDNASLSGTVQDPSGSVVAGAVITARNTNTGVERSMPTNTSGAYVFPNLIPGPYVLTVKAQGFAEETIEGIDLAIGQQARTDVKLHLANVGQEVTVVSAPPLLQTEDASVGTVIDGEHVSALPLDGRQFTQLLQLSPGTLPAAYNYLYKSSDPNNVGRERNGMPAFDVNGGNAAFVTYRLDGVDNSESEFGGASLPISVDAISDMKIQTANFSPEYGRGPSQVDVNMKSGGNTFHGTAFEYLRNQYFDASQWTFTGPHTVNRLKRNQFGATLGGPIRKNKLFFFFDYEGNRQIQSAPQTTTVPSNDMRNGIFPSGVEIYDPESNTPFPNNTIPQNRMNTIALKMLQVFPMANIPGVQNTNASGFLLDPTQNYFYNPNLRRTINQYNLRLDYNLSARDTFFGRYTQSSNDILADGPEASNLGSITGQEQDRLGGRNISATWMHNFGPATINELRFGVSTDPQQYDSVGPNGITPYLQQWGLAGIMSPGAPAGLPSIQIGSTSVSGGNTRPFHVSEANYQGLDNFIIIRGAHTLKLGGEIYRGYRDPYNVARSRGQFRFNGAQTRSPASPNSATAPCPGSTVATSCTGGDAMADFLLGDLSFFEAGNPEPDITRHFTAFAGYAWDTWRLSPRLTVNIGVRYEFTTRETSDPPWYSVPLIQNGDFIGKVAVANTSSGQMSSLASVPFLAAFPGVAVTCRSVGLPDSCVTAPKNQIQPRLGFAWQINPKTVFRGGGGTFFGHVLGDYETEEATDTFPFVSDAKTQTFSSRTTPPPLNLSTLGTIGIPAPALGSAPTNRQNPSTYQWNISLERQFLKSTALSVAYVAVLGRHLETFPPGNCCWYDLPQPYGVVLAPGQKQVQAYPQFNSVEYYSYQNTSDYQSLQVKVVHRLSNGLTLTAAFTHARSMGVNVGLSDPRYPVKAPLYNDVPNTLVISPVYQLPFGAGKPFLRKQGFLNEVIGGWRLSGILSSRSGFPFTPALSGTNLLNYAQLQMDLPDRVCSGKLSNPTPFNWFDKNCFQVPVEPTTPGALLHEGNSGANILRGPMAVNFDAGLSKTLVLKENFALDFRFESFNTLNHPVLGLPGASIAANGNQGPSQITSVISLPRELQFALRLHF